MKNVYLACPKYNIPYKYTLIYPKHHSVHQSISTPHKGNQIATSFAINYIKASW
jgi:hypothetical protein